MKFLTTLLNKSGKIAISTAQAVGLTAVVGVGAIAAYQFLGTSEDDSSTNPFAQYNSGEVTYVSNANTGSYQSGQYGGGVGEEGPLANISNKTIKRLGQQATTDAFSRELEEQEANIQSSSSSMSGYQMGNSEGGLGIGSNEANEMAVKNNPLANMQGAMGGIQDMIAKAQAQAKEGGAADGKDGAATQARGANKLGQAGMAKGMSAGGGEGLNMSFSMQDSGKNKVKGKGGQTGEGANISGGFGSLGSNGRRASFGQERKARAASDELEGYTKYSIDVSNKDDRDASSGNFTLRSKLLGGVTIDGEKVTTGESAGSGDLDTSDLPSKVKGAVAGDESKGTRSNRGFWLVTGAICMFLATVLLIPIIMTCVASLLLWPVGYGLALCVVAACTQLLGRVMEFSQDFHSNALNGFMYDICGAMTTMAIAAATFRWGREGREEFAYNWGKFQEIFGVTISEHRNRVDTEAHDLMDEWQSRRESVVSNARRNVGKWTPNDKK